MFIAAVTCFPIKSSRQVCNLGGFQIGSKFDHRCRRGAEVILARVRIEPEAIQSTEWHICGPPCRFWEADLFQEQRDGIGSKGKRLREAPS